MGVIDLYFVDHEVKVRCRQKVVDCAYLLGWLVELLAMAY
jgi:hypothetical protein